MLPQSLLATARQKVFGRGHSIVANGHRPTRIALSYPSFFAAA